MLLSYFGTLRDLNLQHVVLTEGLEVTVYSDSSEDEDIEMDGVVNFGPIPDPICRALDCWYVRTDPKSLRFVKLRCDDGIGIPCFRCGSDIYESLTTGCCRVCGLDVEYARRRPSSPSTSR